MGGASSTEIGGVRVFKVSPESPAAEAGLEFFFDFIVSINGVKMDPDSTEQFSKKIQEAENGEAKLVVYNGRSHNTREVIVKPRKWAGTGLLGAKVRYDSVEEDENQGIRVLEVFPNSPAAHAGLLPFQDFMLGTAQTVFHDLDELVAAVNQNMGKPMQVYVYNADTETVREVTLAPNNEWGGEGCIGCDIGTGLLHRIPAPRRAPGGNAPSVSMVPQVPLPPAIGAGGVAAPPPVQAQSPALGVGGVPVTGQAPIGGVGGGPAPPPGQNQSVAGIQWPPTSGISPLVDPTTNGSAAPTTNGTTFPATIPPPSPETPFGMPPAPPPTPTASLEIAPVVNVASAVTAVQAAGVTEVPAASPGAALL